MRDEFLNRKFKIRFSMAYFWNKNLTPFRITSPPLSQSTCPFRDSRPHKQPRDFKWFFFQMKEDGTLDINKIVQFTTEARRGNAAKCVAGGE